MSTKTKGTTNATRPVVSTATKASGAKPRKDNAQGTAGVRKRATRVRDRGDVTHRAASQPGNDTYRPGPVSGRPAPAAVYQSAPAFITSRAIKRREAQYALAAKIFIFVLGVMLGYIFHG